MTHHQFDEKPQKPELGKRVENQTDIRKRTNHKVAQRELFKAKEWSVLDQKRIPHLLARTQCVEASVQ